MSSARIGPRRSWVGLSVRGMMLGVGLLSVALGWQHRRDLEQRDAVDAVQRHGGWVYYDYQLPDAEPVFDQEPWGPRWLRGIVGDEPFQQVKSATITDHLWPGTGPDQGPAAWPDEPLEKLAKLPGLKSLTLRDARLTDEAFRHIGRMVDLEELVLLNAEGVTDAGIRHLRGLARLKSIRVKYSGIGDDGLVLLSELPAMEAVCIDGSRISDAGLIRLGGEDRLRKLQLAGSDGPITNRSIHHLKGFRKLEDLGLQDSMVTAFGLSMLQELASLKTLDISQSGVAEEDLATLKRARPTLSITNWPKRASGR